MNSKPTPTDQLNIDEHQALFNHVQSLSTYKLRLNVHSNHFFSYSIFCNIGTRVKKDEYIYMKHVPILYVAIFYEAVHISKCHYSYMKN